MGLAKIKSVAGRAVVVPGDDLDTDQIIPARYLRCVTFEGLGEGLFRDLRFDENGKSKNYPIDRPEHKGASVLISGSNFGCGSSREHAPQAIFHFGLRAVIAESFAEIFFGNCTTLGVPCVKLVKKDLQRLSALASASPQSSLTIDLENKKVTFGIESFALEIPETARQALMAGSWDPLAELLEGADQVAALEAKLPRWSSVTTAGH